MFSDCKTIEQLKVAYHRAARENHPDRGGDTATMQQINAEYAARFEQLQRGATGAATAETPEEFIQIINQLLTLSGLEVELCGRWVWIGGNTYPHREALKAAGCRWSKNKGRWYWHKDGDAGGWSRRRSSMPKIRAKYGSVRYEADTEKRAAIA